MLELLGLDKKAEAVYRCMLANPEAGIASLGGLTGLSEQEIRATLDQLNELALVRPQNAESENPHAVSPDLGLEILLARQQAELAIHQSRVEESRAAAAELMAQYADMRFQAAANGNRLTDVHAVREQLASMTRKVRNEVLCFAPNGAHSEESLRAAKPLDGQLLDRGVKMRTVYLDSVRNSPHTQAYAHWLAERGGEVRTAPALPVRMIITDRSCAVISTSTESSGDGAVVITGEGTLAALCALFEGVWLTSTALSAPPEPDDRGLTPQESQVLEFLYQGLTDETIAKRLGVSQRTARRIANTLMTRLNARSRFQAGAMAVQNGWLPAQPA
ncbi:LuxR C-terminal-related transcriptional regulator [Streptomyces sp. WI04-05B]|uniref:helix-turn-helix transcriptional regulator n=1 Tax=Streptomyces TaxID=1883 RepID=UPI0029BC1289|nr:MULTISPECIES: helix-turn-helix transcriptional regulator [unclassified Streptomyces]MDX2547320.1 helix-turn-helix transcriptional regulator [Streptomyces sp. WI04-05B]MDX2589808.1 helix-turn-helix transcriptional regulator [Streptomyces sp. WI04-05A]MDX3753455.1 helix-turn-helix transcriptional regulator [Streptomyces sp. AK08-02]